MALIEVLKRFEQRAQKAALSHPLARWNKTIAALAAGVTAFVGLQYGNDAVSTVADVLSIVSVFWVPNAPKAEPGNIPVKA